MPNHASATVIGHLGQDPVTKHLPSGDAVTEFSVAHTYKRKAGDITTWYRCAAFGKTGEIVSQYLAKGDATMVIGTPYLEEWEAKDGGKRQTLKLAVDRVVLLGKRADAAVQDKPAPKASSGSGFEDMEDDTPW